MELCCESKIMSKYKIVMSRLTESEWVGGGEYQYLIAR